MKALLERKDSDTIGMLLNSYDYRFGMLWRLGVSTGFRVGDLLGLRVRDVGKTISIVEQKTKRARTVELSNDICNLLYEYVELTKLSKNNYLFYRNRQNKNVPMSRQWAHRCISKTAASYGFADIGPHSMRKIYACCLMRSTGSLEAVQKSLGHKYLSTTMIYLRDLIESSFRGA